MIAGGHPFTAKSCFGNGMHLPTAWASSLDRVGVDE